jgi:hypothetical protein
MVSLKARAEMLGRTEAELRAEMAASLGRIGRTLTSLIAELNHIRQESNSISECERSAKLDQYRSVRSRAKLYFWYLTVQREAIGLRNHESLVDLYPIPGQDLS